MKETLNIGHSIGKKRRRWGLGCGDEAFGSAKGKNGDRRWGIKGATRENETE